MTKKLKPTKRSMSEVIASMQKSFLKTYKNLLTEEEAIEYVDRIRTELREKGERDYENKKFCRN